MFIRLDLSNNKQFLQNDLFDMFLIGDYYHYTGLSLWQIILFITGLILILNIALHGRWKLVSTIPVLLFWDLYTAN